MLIKIIEYPMDDLHHHSQALIFDRDPTPRDVPREIYIYQHGLDKDEADGWSINAGKGSHNQNRYTVPLHTYKCEKKLQGAAELAMQAAEIGKRAAINLRLLQTYHIVVILGEHPDKPLVLCGLFLKPNSERI